jgi:hypothetical protein
MWASSLTPRAMPGADSSQVSASGPTITKRSSCHLTQPSPASPGFRLSKFGSVPHRASSGLTIWLRPRSKDRISRQKEPPCALAHWPSYFAQLKFAGCGNLVKNMDSAEDIRTNPAGRGTASITGFAVARTFTGPRTAFLVLTCLYGYVKTYSQLGLVRSTDQLLGSTENE